MTILQQVEVVVIFYAIFSVNGSLRILCVVIAHI